MGLDPTPSPPHSLLLCTLGMYSAGAMDEVVFFAVLESHAHGRLGSEALDPCVAICLQDLSYMPTDAVSVAFILHEHPIA